MTGLQPVAMASFKRLPIPPPAGERQKVDRPISRKSSSWLRALPLSAATSLKPAASGSYLSFLRDAFANARLAFLCTSSQHMVPKVADEQDVASEASHS